MRIAVGIDTRGEMLRPSIMSLLARLQHEASMVPAGDEQETEYPEIAAAVAHRICDGNVDRGILIGRTGMSLCVVANKFPGIRAAVCHDELTAEMGRRRLDLNVLCLPSDLLSAVQVERIIIVWLATPFEDGRYTERLQRIESAEHEAAAYATRPAGR
jgi:ribose 5-phosphate isomerase B